MRHHIIIYTLLLSAALPHPSKAAGDTTDVAPAVREWEDQSVLHVNRRPARSWFMPFVNRRGDSEMSLNGEWEFRWAPTPAAVGTARWTTLHVPANWEVNGYGTPVYASAGYTFKVRPPFVMDEPKETFTTYIERNPTGEYRRTFRLPASWHGGHTFLRFDGVMSAFYVSINGKAVGYSQGSNSPAEFDITPFLKPGDNSIRLTVHKYSDASYLEDQDGWRFGGVHRDITLFHTPSLHIRDIALRTIAADSTYRNFRLLVHPYLESLDGSDGSTASLSATLLDASGKELARTDTVPALPILDMANKASVMNEWYPQRGRRKFGHISLDVNGVSGWTAETPVLYTLRLALHDASGATIQQIEQKVGFRQVEIRNGQLLVNGKAVRFRGVNRVEHDPYTAHVMSEERMLQDLRLMKRAHINAVRTAHYPSHPRWYDLCDSLGIYVLDEADCENHGVRGKLTSLSSWNAAMTDRVIRLAERDKNHPSVIMWSLGNESGFGANHSAMAGWLHEFDPTRPVHYEGAQGTTEGGDKTPRPTPDPPCVDVISRFYPRVMAEYLNPGIPEGSDKERAENARWEHLLAIAQRQWTFSGGWLDGVTDNRPVMTSEYAHCMGNALGNLKEYWDEIYSHPRMLGGFIWDWADQGIIRDGKVLYGGDFGDKPNLKAFCLNGVVKCDRSLTAKYREVQHIYSPVQLRRHGDKVFVINRHHHTSLSAYTLTGILQKNGRRGTPFAIPVPDVQPGDSAHLACIDSYLNLREPDTDIRLNILVTRNTQTAAPHGTKSQTRRKTPKKACALPSAGDPAFCHECQIPISGSVMDYVSETRPAHPGKASDEAIRIAESATATFFRAPTDNDKSFGNWLAKDWKNHKLDTPHIVHVSKDTVSGGSVKTEDYQFAEGSIRVTTTVRLLPDASVDIIQEYECRGTLPELPRMGIQLTLPSAFEQIEYYGRGPWDTYPDRWQSSTVGLWSSTVRSEYAHFPVPQDCGNHSETSCVTLRTADHRTFRVDATDAPFTFSALHYTPQDIASVRHDHELSERDATILSIDCATLGIGNSSCGPGVLKRYSIDKSVPHCVKINIRLY